VRWGKITYGYMGKLKAVKPPLGGDSTDGTRDYFLMFLGGLEN
jgi:hypothetical protein